MSKFSEQYAGRLGIHRSLGGAQPGNWISKVAGRPSPFILLAGRPLPFSLLAGALPFPFWDPELSLFLTPPPQTSYPTLVGLIGIDPVN